MPAARATRSHAPPPQNRLARAKDLLRTTSLSCEQIAAACGIYDANHLGHLFRRKFGASPSAFRSGS